MIKPNFSESQLQQLVNTEITMFCYSRLYPLKRWWFHPIIVDLIEEGEVGWDSAFYFPWLSIRPDNSGANFFIQYKLSKLIEGKRGKEWKYWNASYLRFQIPYMIKDKSTKKYSDDFSQFNALKKLATKGYSVFYATNHTVERQKLFSLASGQRLLNEIPFLDVSSVAQLHKKVTFTEKSGHFLLHSDIDKITKVKLNEIASKLKEVKKRNLTEDIGILTEFLIEIEKELDIENKNSFKEKIKKYESYADTEVKKYFETSLIAKYLKLYLDCYWYRI